MTNLTLFAVAVLCTLLCVLMTAAEMSAEEKMYMEECKSAHNLTDEDFQAMSNEPEAVPMNIKCFMHCLFEKFDVLDDDGRVNVEKAMQDKGMDEEGKQKLEACVEAYDNDSSELCESSFNIVACMMGRRTESDYEYEDADE